MWIGLPAQLPAATGLFSIVGGAILIPLKKKIVFAFATVVALFASFYSYHTPPTLKLSEFKSLSRVLNVPETQIIVEQNTPHGLVQIVSSPALRYAPGLSLAYQRQIPASDLVFNNGDWVGARLMCRNADSLHLLDYTTVAAPFIMNTRNRVLILQARAGMLMALAMAHRSQQIIAVEPHTALFDILQKDLADDAGSPILRSPVTAVNLDPRSFLFSDTLTHDLILLPMLDAFGESSGMYALQEQNLLTSEAFTGMWNRLTPEGVIAVSTWVDYPLRNPLRLLATVVEMLSSAGIENVADHIAAIRSWGTITFVVKRTPLRDKEIQRVRDFCRQMMFDPALLPDINPNERDRYNQVSDSLFFRSFDALLSSDRSEFIDGYDFNIRPATNNRPYFSQFLRWKSVGRLAELVGQSAVPFVEIGSWIVLITLIQIAGAALLLILAPLFKLRSIASHRMWTLLYFGGLGMGYMLFEIVCIQQFVLFFGHPVYATAAVISALLIVSGVGSFVSSRLGATSTIVFRLSVLSLVIILFYAYALHSVLLATIAIPLEAKALVCISLIAPPAFVMGMLFPLGLRFLAGKSEAQLPWAWGINGSVSVVSTALASVLVVEIGFFFVMIFSATAYGIAAIATRLGVKNISGE